MKKALGAIAISTILTACGGSDVDFVKQGTMNFNQTTTLGQALDNWENCGETSWNSKVTPSGVRTVIFSCQYNNNYLQPYLDKLKSSSSEEEEIALQIDSITANLFFTINNDDTFQIDHVEVVYKWQDGATVTETARGGGGLLEAAYNNGIAFNSENITQYNRHQKELQFTMLRVKHEEKKID